MHDFVMDGVKRDRLPWAGDLAMSIMPNISLFVPAGATALFAGREIHRPEKIH